MSLNNDDEPQTVGIYDLQSASISNEDELDDTENPQDEYRCGSNESVLIPQIPFLADEEIIREKE